jgi:mono/diheme cytochrome c family protein
MAPGQIFHVISNGSGRMPSYAGQIPADERWLIVHYVLTLRQAGSAAR